MRGESAGPPLRRRPGSAIPRGAWRAPCGHPRAAGRVSSPRRSRARAGPRRAVLPPPSGGAGLGACGGRARREAPAQVRAAPRRSQAKCCQVGIQGSASEAPRRVSGVATSTSLPAGRISVKKPLPPWSPLSPAFLLGNPLLISAWDLQGPTSGEGRQDFKVPEIPALSLALRPSVACQSVSVGVRSSIR